MDLLLPLHVFVHKNYPKIHLWTYRHGIMPWNARVLTYVNLFFESILISWIMLEFLGTVIWHPSFQYSSLTFYF